MKKIGISSILFSSTLLTISIAHAEPYVGLNLGASVVTISKELTYNVTETDLSDKYSGVRAQVLLGYNFRSSNNVSFDETNNSGEIYGGDEWYYAIEAALNYNSNSATENITPWFLTTNASVREQVEYSYDIFALVKYRVNPNVILFIGPGFTQGEFNTTSTETGGNLGVTGNYSKWLNGWSVKAGIEVPVAKCMTLVAAYQFSEFNHITWTNIEPLTGDGVSARYNPIVNSLTLGFNFQI